MSEAGVQGDLTQGDAAFTAMDQPGGGGSAERDVVEVLAEEFAALVRNGEPGSKQ